MSMTEKERYEAGRSAFFEKYPKAKRSDNIKCLNLIMKKEFAEAILKGEKTVEFRAYSQHYVDRLYDKNVVDFGDTYVKDEDMDDYLEFMKPLRVVEKIHFHNYNNTWSLDVEVIDNWTVTATKEDIAFLQDDYNCHELDEVVRDLDRQKARNRPIFFYFALGKVLSREGI